MTYKVIDSSPSSYDRPSIKIIHESSSTIFSSNHGGRVLLELHASNLLCKVFEIAHNCQQQIYQYLFLHLLHLRLLVLFPLSRLVDLMLLKIHFRQIDVKPICQFHQIPSTSANLAQIVMGLSGFSHPKSQSLHEPAFASSPTSSVNNKNTSVTEFIPPLLLHV